MEMKLPLLGPSRGEVVRDGAAELGVLNGHGSP